MKQTHNAPPVYATIKSEWTRNAYPSLLQGTYATQTKSVTRGSVAIGNPLKIAVVPNPLQARSKTTMLNAYISPLAQEATSVGARNIFSVIARRAEAAGVGRLSQWRSHAAIGTNVPQIFAGSTEAIRSFAAQKTAQKVEIDAQRFRMTPRVRLTTTINVSTTFASPVHAVVPVMALVVNVAEMKTALGR